MGNRCFTFRQSIWFVGDGTPHKTTRGVIRAFIHEKHNPNKRPSITTAGFAGGFH